MSIGSNLLRRALASYVNRRDELHEEIRVLRAQRVTNEKARKRLLGATLLTSQNPHRIHSLRTLIAKTTAENAPLIRSAIRNIGIIESAHSELMIYERQERRIARERHVNDLRRLPTQTYDFVDRLYNDFSIDAGSLSTMLDKDFRAIADIILHRHTQVVTHVVPQNMTMLDGSPAT